MSWASRRRARYATGIIVFLGIVIGVPLAIYLYEPPSCIDGKQNQNETAVDAGGPCTLLDARSLSPSSVLWSRSFSVRGGAYSAVAYIENPNKEAGVRAVAYRFGLYDSGNVLVAERKGTAFIMPGGITPVFEGAINTGNRVVARTYFEFTEPLVWLRMANAASVISISNRNIEDAASAPRLAAFAENTSVKPVFDVSFTATIFDPAGNAFAASATTLSRLAGGEKSEIVFTWPDAFERVVGRIDITPLLPPVEK